MKRTVIFKDAARNKVTFEAEIENGRFSASGEYCGIAGQCFDSVKPANDNQRKLIALWSEWHLNDVNAGTIKQSEQVKGMQYDEALNKLTSIDRQTGKESFFNYAVISKQIDHFKNEIHIIDKWYKTASVSENDIERGEYYKVKREEYSTELLKLEEILNNTLLYDVDPRDENKLYRYGSAWLLRSLPENFEDDLNTLMDDIETEEEEAKDRTVTEEDSDLFNEFSDQETAHALALMFGLSVNEIEEIEEEGNNRWTVQGVSYLAGTDEEMDEEWDSYLESYIDDCLEIPKEMDRYFDREAWKEDAKQDGRGHSLNNWNGGEESISLGGTDYYAYRN